MKNYQCNKCFETIQSATQPLTRPCSKSGNHTWQELSTDDDETYDNDKTVEDPYDDDETYDEDPYDDGEIYDNDKTVNECTYCGEPCSIGSVCENCEEHHPVLNIYKDL